MFQAKLLSQTKLPESIVNMFSPVTSFKLRVTWFCFDMNRRLFLCPLSAAPKWAITFVEILYLSLRLAQTKLPESTVNMVSAVTWFKLRVTWFNMNRRLFLCPLSPAPKRDLNLSSYSVVSHLFQKQMSQRNLLLCFI